MTQGVNRAGSHARQPCESASVFGLHYAFGLAFDFAFAFAFAFGFAFGFAFALAFGFDAALAFGFDAAAVVSAGATVSLIDATPPGPMPTKLPWPSKLTVSSMPVN